MAGSIAERVYHLKRSRWSVLAGVLPILSVYVALLVIPMLLLGQFSLYRKLTGEMGQVVLIREVSLANYAKFLASPFYFRILKDTLVMALTVTGLCVLLGYPVAFSLSRARRWKGILYLLVLAPFFVSVVIRTYGWMVILGHNGLVNWLLLASGLVTAPVPLIYNYTGILIGVTHIMLPYMVITLEAVLRKIDRSLIEAAQGLGANPWQAFSRVIFPLSLPGLLAGSLLVFALSVSIFTTPSLMGGGRIHLMSTIIYEETMGQVNWPSGAMLAWVLLVTTLAVLGLSQLAARRFEWRR
ncbi:MAG: ABC transporter permease [Deltaproteobacteria bacterium]|nr:ABC transporter permease [Deltaproteobacteria bacterium]